MRLASEKGNRVIALPASDPEADLYGIKWVSSFPRNVVLGKDRASAVIVMNSLTDGTPVAVLNGTTISAMRTAASAVLMALCCHGTSEVERVSLVGCGPLNYEVLRFLTHSFPCLSRVVLTDSDKERARAFAHRAAAEWCHLSFTIADSANLETRTSILCFATSALTPHVESVGDVQTILHLSLRDLSTSVIATGFNVTDDRSQAETEGTSLCLARREFGESSIDATIGEVLSGMKSVGRGKPVIFSPFGLGILDLVVAELVLDLAQGLGLGTEVEF